jgi:hypothetical protein
VGPVTAFGLDHMSHFQHIVNACDAHHYLCMGSTYRANALYLSFCCCCCCCCQVLDPCLLPAEGLDLGGPDMDKTLLDALEGRWVEHIIM